MKNKLHRTVQYQFILPKQIPLICDWNTKGRYYRRLADGRGYGCVRAREGETAKQNMHHHSRLSATLDL